ncbi:DUF1731 domain-containing protein [Tsukamurella soli]|uniref:DUF1731 domain-containing protein n=1 Tax=Tsukamurella soli TaxID=644556 RepID=A0ABP8K290_9ACTN
MGIARNARQFIAAPLDAVWAVLSDLDELPRWHPIFGSLAVVGGAAGPVATGMRADWRPVIAASWVHRRFAPPIEVTACDPGRLLELTQPEPLGATVVRWELHGDGAGTLVTQTVSSTGPSAPLYDRILARRLAARPNTTLALLARRAGAACEAPLNVVIAGGSGLLGRRIAADLTSRGHAVAILTRAVDPALAFRQVEWDGRTVGAWADELAKPRTAVINLAGKLVDCRPTAANIAALTRSRVEPTRALVAAVARLGRPVPHWVQASTTAIWSDAGETPCTEGTPLPDPGLPQMTGVALPWEEAVAGAAAERLTILRTSIVLESESPALGRLVSITRAGAGGRVGDGRQWFSWIHIDDWLAAVRRALGTDDGAGLPAGVVVAATENPVRNAELMRQLRRRLHRPPSPPTPAPLLAVGAIALRTDPALGLTGRYATSTMLREVGFEFRFPTLDVALADLLPSRA